MLNAVSLPQAAQYHEVLLEAQAVRLFFLGFEQVFCLQLPLSEVPLPQVASVATSDRSLPAAGYHTVIHKFII